MNAKRVPAQGDFSDDDPHLGERGDASDDFTSLWTRVVIPANSAVAAPRLPASSRAAGACSKQRPRAQQQKTPGVNRERSVIDGARRCGPPIARGSQLEKGSNALLQATATMRRMAMIVALVGVSPAVSTAPPNSSDRLSVPATCRSRTAADKHGRVADSVNRHHTIRIRYRRRALLKERDEQC